MKKESNLSPIGVFAVFLFLSSVAAAGPNTDPRCESLTGAAFGLCTAAIAMGCDNPDTEKPGCEAIANNYTNLTGEEVPPWWAFCSDNTHCMQDEYCSKADGDCSGQGICEIKPDACSAIGEPVVGCDDQTYGNACDAAFSGVSIRIPYRRRL